MSIDPIAAIECEITAIPVRHVNQYSSQQPQVQETAHNYVSSASTLAISKSLKSPCATLSLKPAAILW